MPNEKFKIETENFFDDYHDKDKTLSKLTKLDKYLMKNYFLNISKFLLDEIRCHNNILENLKVLDIGCGSGEYLIFLNDNLKNGEYCGVEISQSAIDHANINLKKNEFDFFGDPYLQKFTYKVNAKNFKFSKINGADLPFQENYFDVVYFVMVLHHTYEYEKIIKEAQRVLKNDGVLIVIDLKGQSELKKMFIKSIFTIMPGFLIKKVFKNDLVLEDGKIPFRSDISFDKTKVIVNKIKGCRIIEAQTHYMLAGYFILFLKIIYSDFLFLFFKPFFSLIIIVDKRLSRIFRNNCDCFAIVIKKTK